MQDFRLAPLPEPWLRGPLPDVSPLLAPVIYAFEQAREDLFRHAGGLTTAQVWIRPFGLEPVGFQLRHIAGSIGRLLTYLAGDELDAQQLAALDLELEPGESSESLLWKVSGAIDEAEAILRKMDVAALTEPRVVGRKRLPTTVIGLAVHLAEHTQRHVGQAISAAKLARRVLERD